MVDLLIGLVAVVLAALMLWWFGEGRHGGTYDDWFHIDGDIRVQ